MSEDDLAILLEELGEISQTLDDLKKHIDTVVGDIEEIFKNKRHKAAKLAATSATH